jgi:hypothetical protein
VVGPDSVFCEICMEEGLTRKCCGHVYCNHDYYVNKECPNCKKPTKKEKKVTDAALGVQYLSQGFSEAEECRSCLDLGLKRRCCGNYYCDTCYCECFVHSLHIMLIFFKIDKDATCKSCGASVGKKGLNSQFKNKASVPSVLLGWCASVFVALVLVAGVVTIIASEVQAPMGIYGNLCSSFFAQCNTPVCIDIDYSIGNSPYNSLGPLYDWRYCTLNSTVKLQAMACVFDHELYVDTSTGLGFDVCEDTYEDGVYVFEDTFEHWTNLSDYRSNLMKSAVWAKQVNAEANSNCGASHGRKALVFSGKFYRFMETSDVDVTFGGFVEADLFIAPEGVGSSFPK